MKIQMYIIFMFSVETTSHEFRLNITREDCSNVFFTPSTLIEEISSLIKNSSVYLWLVFAGTSTPRRSPLSVLSAAKDSVRRGHWPCIRRCTCRSVNYAMRIFECRKALRQCIYGVGKKIVSTNKSS